MHIERSESQDEHSSITRNIKSPSLCTGSLALSSSGKQTEVDQRVNTPSVLLLQAGYQLVGESTQKGSTDAQGKQQLSLLREDRSPPVPVIFHTQYQPRWPFQQGELYPYAV